MAKGNLFQGMARGKVGDVVFSRANGEQISRVRNRHPKNPRTKGQLYQRAIMASIVQAYSAGKEIFDHSFEGYAVGAQCQREFIKRNAKMLRDLVSIDINNETLPKDQKARVIAPGISSPVPNPYIVSRGSYEKKVFQMADVATGYKLPETLQKETAKAYAARVGLIAGDIYTLVCFWPTDSLAYKSSLNNDVLANQKFCRFGYIRMTVKSEISETETEFDYAALFDYELGGIDEVNFDPNISINEGNLAVNQFGATEGAYGLIHSRKDQDLRSTTELNVIYGTGDKMFGIVPYYLLDEWANATSSIGDSDLILEGGNV